MLLMGSFLTLSAQKISVQGTVVSATDDEPLIGVSVGVSGQPTMGTMTDIDGNF